MAGPTTIPAHDLAPGDLPYALNAAFPWLRPTTAIGLVDGVEEIDAAAAFEGYGGVSFATRTLVIGAGDTVTTRHGLVLVTRPARGGAHGVDRFVVPGVKDASGLGTALGGWARRNHLIAELPGGGKRLGEFGFDPVLRDLAEHSDRRTALTTAKFSEYPTAHLHLTGASWPWRPTLLAAAAAAASVAVGLVPTLIRHTVRQRRHTTSAVRWGSPPQGVGSPREVGDDRQVGVAAHDRVGDDGY
jgi:hypothetical protein